MVFGTDVSWFRNVAELRQMSPSLAVYYSFHSPEAIPSESSSQLQASHIELGYMAALEELRSLGCTFATKDWVKNHWALILWKLAGMVCLDPESESDPTQKRWCWGEVIRQLRYR